MSILDLKQFLDEAVDEYNRPNFIPNDPISIPYQFTQKEDIEIIGFLTATIAWGQRATILKNCQWLIEHMDYAPEAFIMQHQQKDLKPFSKFVHRTFNGVDCVYFLQALQSLYKNHGGLEESFNQAYTSTQDLAPAISTWRQTYFSYAPPGRSAKHFADPLRNSSAKRICMYLRWMVRKDKKGVDFGIWKTISPAILNAPLDVHSGRIARSLGLLERKQDDWKAVIELSDNLRLLDPKDPAKYDFALFGIGVNEKLSFKS
jgi:uncharacterized protein (TIGR02757 family)